MPLMTMPRSGPPARTSGTPLPVYWLALAGELSTCHSVTTTRSLMSRWTVSNWKMSPGLELEPGVPAVFVDLPSSLMFRTRRCSNPWMSILRPPVCSVCSEPFRFHLYEPTFGRRPCGTVAVACSAGKAFSAASGHGASRADGAGAALFVRPDPKSWGGSAAYPLSCPPVRIAAPLPGTLAGLAAFSGSFTPNTRSASNPRVFTLDGPGCTHAPPARATARRMPARRTATRRAPTRRAASGDGGDFRTLLLLSPGEVGLGRVRVAQGQARDERHHPHRARVGLGQPAPERAGQLVGDRREVRRQPVLQVAPQRAGDEPGQLHVLLVVLEPVVEHQRGVRRMVVAVVGGQVAPVGVRQRDHGPEPGLLRRRPPAGPPVGLPEGRERHVDQQQEQQGGHGDRHDHPELLAEDAGRRDDEGQEHLRADVVARQYGRVELLLGGVVANR